MTHQHHVQFDLVDEMQWEDVASEQGLFVPLELAGFEESSHQPIFGGNHAISNGIYDYTAWFYDGDESAFSVA